MHLVSCRTSRDGKRAWCQVRPARRRVHGWAMPTRSRPERLIPAAQLIRSGPRFSCGDGLSASSDAWLHLGSALLLKRCGRTSPAARGAHVMRSAVRREKLGGCLSSARAGQRPPRGYIAKCRVCKRSVPYTHSTSPHIQHSWHVTKPKVAQAYASAQQPGPSHEGKHVLKTLLLCK